MIVTRDELEILMRSIDDYETLRDLETDETLGIEWAGVEARLSDDDAADQRSNFLDRRDMHRDWEREYRNA